MPTPGSSRAPDFNPKYPTELKDFFQEFEEHAKACGLDEKEKARVVVRYTDGATKRFWRSLEGYEESYEVLKERILDSYSKMQLGDKFTTNGLIKLITKSANGTVDDETDLNTYYRQFWPIASHLVKNKKINIDDRDCYFWQGIPSDTRRGIRNRLETKDHTFDHSQVPTITQAMEAGQFVLTREAADSD
ncbi:hypothetical protein BYT27DRAFT_7053861, partial [Phlegmacium glaucopus]